MKTLIATLIILYACGCGGAVFEPAPEDAGPRYPALGEPTIAMQDGGADAYPSK